jgi:hypothetical protein
VSITAFYLILPSQSHRLTPDDDKKRHSKLSQMTEEIEVRMVDVAHRDKV